MAVSTRRGGADDLDVLVPLFEGYRQFYKQAPDEAAARDFLAARLDQNESIIFLAEDGERALGFTQLYPSFSSVRGGKIFILNDLFVTPEARGTGAGRALLDAAAVYARGEAAIGLSLSTAIDNEAAQRLYEAHGWVRDQTYYHYNLTL